MEKGKISTTLPTCLFFGLAGLVANWFRVELFFNQEFLFGSSCVILAILMRVGVAYGALTGFIAGIYTYFLWNHPWALIVVTCEALFVAGMYARLRGNIVIYDMAYWAFVGMPLIFVFYHYFMGIQLQSTVFVMLKQMVNGVFNALVAFAIAVTFRYRKITEGEWISFSNLIFVIMESAVLLPALLLFLIGLRTYPDIEKEAFESKLAHNTEIIRSTLSDWIDDHRYNIRAFAGMVANMEGSSAETLQHRLETVRAASTTFSSMGILNEDSVPIAFSPEMDEDGKSIFDPAFSGLPDLRAMRENKKTMVLDLVMSKTEKPVPKLLLLSPVLVAAEYRGYCAGVLELTQITAMLTNFALRDGIDIITLMDGSGKVIASTSRDLAIMDPLPPQYVESRGATPSVAFYRMPHPRSSTNVQRWGESFMVKTAHIDQDYGWRVVVETSFAPVFERVSRYSTIALALLSILTFITVILSHLFSRSVVSPIVRLRDATRYFPEQLEKVADFNWPRSNIRELADLSINFQGMAYALSASFRRLAEFNETLEQRIRSRTEELRREVEERRRTEISLRESEERFRKIFEEGPLGMAIIEANYGFSKVNSKLCEMLGYTEQELCDLSFPAVAKFHDPCLGEDLIDSILANAIPSIDTENIYVTMSGDIMWGHSSLSAIRYNAGNALYGLLIVENITRRKVVEEELDNYREHLENLVQSRTSQLAMVNEQLMREIEHRKTVEEALRSGQKQLHALGVKLAESEESERRRLALELHDRVGQNLSTLNINLNILKTLIPAGSNPNCAERIRDSLALVRETFKSIRDVMADLRPPVLDDYGLAAAVRWYADLFRERTGIETTVQAEDFTARVPLHIETALFRIMQEALSNVARHAKATNTTVTLTEAKCQVRMKVEDNGVGFDTRAEPASREPRWGLMSMKERAEGIGGTLRIRSKPGKGTEVVIIA
ncbi:MAG: PAS domain S-box protein [Syntrophobacter sp.]